jgi:hypothetical protein
VNAVEFRGGCHCGALQFRFTTAKAPRDWSIRVCQCMFCRKVDAISTSDPQGSLEFVEQSTSALHRYRFGTGTADFLICAFCGVYVGAMIDTPEGRFGIINVRALAQMPADLPPPQPMNYDGESAGSRTSRRQQRWSPVS